MNRYELGKRGELFACEYLKKKNCKILRKNYRVGRIGEIDLIASQNGRLCFVEVKTRTGYTYGTPSEAVSYKKRKTITNVAVCFLKEYGAADIDVQFDVIEIIMTKNGKLLNINHIEQAF